MDHCLLERGSGSRIYSRKLVRASGASVTVLCELCMSSEETQIGWSRDTTAALVEYYIHLNVCYGF